MTELQILELVASILFPVFIGWIIVRMNWVEASSDEILTWLFLHVCTPPLIIVLLSKQDLASLLDLRFILATLVMLGLLYGGLLFVHRFLLRRPLDMAAMAAFSGTKFNTVIVGLPVLLAAVGHHAVIPTIINLIAGYFTILPATLFLTHIGATGNTSGVPFTKLARKALKSVVTHPLVAATLVGLILAEGDVHLSPWLEKTFLTLGDAAIPLALIAVGMSLRSAGTQGNLAEISWMSAVRMIISPALAIIVAMAFELEPVFAIALVISFSLPTAKMVLPLAREQGVYVEQAAAIITLTTVSLIVAWPIVIWVCEHLWPGVIATHGY